VLGEQLGDLDRRVDKRERACVNSDCMPYTRCSVNRAVARTDSDTSVSSSSRGLSAARRVVIGWNGTPS